MRRLVLPVSSVVVGRWAPPIGLVSIWAVMTVLNPRFVSAVNLTNLVLQIVAIGTIAMGVVLVLLIREIDLSVGAVSGFGAAVVAVLSVKHGWAAGPAVLAGLATGVAVGSLHGALVTRVGVPSFVVTLAGLLAWQGGLLLTLGETGSLNITDPQLVAITGTFLRPVVGWIMALTVIVVGAVQVGREVVAEGSVSARTGWRWGLAGVGVVVAVTVFNADRGTPVAVVLFLALLGLFDAVVRRTRLGRHALAIGSNAEVARRAGIPVDRVRVTVFALTSALAVTGGIMAASRLLAVNQSSGSTDLMIGAIAAAVIGGTSLFGGRGSIWSALLGSLVVGSLTNGLNLLGVSSAVQSLATGAVLALAVGLDALSRRADDRRSRRGTTGAVISSAR